jgi:hypothetical protein
VTELERGTNEQMNHAIVAVLHDYAAKSPQERDFEFFEEAKLYSLIGEYGLTIVRHELDKKLPTESIVNDNLIRAEAALENLDQILYEMCNDEDRIKLKFTEMHSKYLRCWYHAGLAGLSRLQGNASGCVAEHVRARDLTRRLPNSIYLTEKVALLTSVSQQLIK